MGSSRDMFGKGMQTLKDIDDALPNGFHDAHLERIEMDYERRVTVFDIDVLVSGPDDATSATLDWLA